MMRHAGLVSVATLLSRILGYVRDALVAGAFGGGALTDAYYAAFRLSNLFRRILGEGPLSTAFVPVFSEHLVREEGNHARSFFYALFTFLSVVLVGVVLVGILASPLIVTLGAGGFKSAGGDTFHRTVALTRLMFPFLFFVCLAALSSAALNAKGYFFLPAVAPSMLSVATIGYIFLIKKWTLNPLAGLAISTSVGGALHFLMLLPALKRANLSPRWRWDPTHPDILKVGLLVLPAVWGLSVDQINGYVDTICASFLMEGSVTALYNSSRLMQFALALFGMSVSTATLPHLSLSAAEGDWMAFKKNLNFSLRMTLFLVVPAMTGLIVLARPIVQVLFEHGQFTSEQTTLTAYALVGYVVGLPAYSLVKVLVTAFYARRDTRTPVRVATLCLFVNVVGNFILMKPLGVAGLAIATSMASFVNVGVLIVSIRKQVGLLGGRLIARTLGLTVLASLLMAGVSLSVFHFGFGGLMLRVPVAVMGGVLVFGVTARVLRMDEYFQVRELLIRGKKDEVG